MPWVVDTCIILDILDDDPDFGERSATTVDEYFKDGLVICPVTYIELAPGFLGNQARMEEFLREINIDYAAGWSKADSEHAFQSWNRYVDMKRRGQTAKRPIADIQIGAFADRRQGLITRNPADFSPVFSELAIILP